MKYPRYKLDHFGVVVADISASLSRYRELGLVPPITFAAAGPSPSIIDTLQDVEVCFVDLTSRVTVELIRPLSAESPVAKRVPSIAHTCYRVNPVLFEETLNDASTVIVSPPKPAIAFNSKRVMFIFDALLGGVVELIEDPGVYHERYGNDRICVCTHPYYRHFDPFEGDEGMYVHCKYCGCDEFRERT